MLKGKEGEESFVPEHLNEKHLNEDLIGHRRSQGDPITPTGYLNSPPMVRCPIPYENTDSDSDSDEEETDLQGPPSVREFQDQEHLFSLILTKR